VEFLNISKITLGTAQLGLNYGFNNITGKPNIEECLNILNYAYINGINSFDTAQAYGKSEEIIGVWIKNYKPKNVFITTKIIIPKINIDKEKLEVYLDEKIYSSLGRLNTSVIDNLVLHRFDDLEFFKEELINSLLKFKNRELINKLGVSLYDVSELEKVIEYGIFDSVQIPSSIFDQRFIKSGTLKKAKENNILVFCRSIFLQGLMFRHPKSIPIYLRGIEDYLIKLNEFAKSHNISIQEIAINYLKDIDEIDSLLIGIDNVMQLKENIRIFKSNKDFDYYEIVNDLNEIPNKFLDPRKWKV